MWELKKTNSVLFSLPTIWWLDILKRIEKIILESVFDKKIKNPGLNFTPGSALTGVRTTGPRMRRTCTARHAQKGLVPERPISVNPGLKFCSVFVFYLPMCFLEYNFVLSLLYLGVKADQYFVSSSRMFLDKKRLLKIWLNPRLNLSSFQEPGPEL